MHKQLSKALFALGAISLTSVGFSDNNYPSRWRIDTRVKRVNHVNYEVRCLNCLKRFEIQPKTDKATCLHCKTNYRISWPRPDQPKIRGIAK